MYQFQKCNINYFHPNTAPTPEEMIPTFTVDMHQSAVGLGCNEKRWKYPLADECHNWPRAVPGRRSRRLRRRLALVERCEQKLWARDKTISALPGAEFGAILKPRSVG